MSELRHVFYAQPMNQVYIESIAMYVIWTIAMILLRGKARQIICIISAFLAVVLIIDFTVLGRSDSNQTMSLTPFISFVNAKVQPELYRTMFMNMLLFLPLGLSLPFALPDRIKHKVLISVISGVILSVGVETLQLIFSLGKCETDDVLMNTLGMIIGGSSCLISNLILQHKKRKKMNR